MKRGQEESWEPIQEAFVAIQPEEARAGIRLDGDMEGVPFRWEQETAFS